MRKLNTYSIKTFPGQEKAWDILSGLNPEEVSKNALALFDSNSGLYTVKSFGIDFFVSPIERKVSTNVQLGRALLDIKEYFFELSVVWYLASARSNYPSGRWIKPVNVKGGQIFALGTHKLPLEELAEVYGNNPEAFIKKAKEFGGIVCNNAADVCIEFYPFPKIPIQLLLWLEDEEFPPRVDLMLDTTCDIHLPTDVIWSITNVTVLIMF